MNKAAVMLGVVALAGVAWWYAEARDPTIVEPFKAAARRAVGDVAQRCADAGMKNRAEGVPWFIAGSGRYAKHHEVHVRLLARPALSQIVVWCVCKVEADGSFSDAAAYSASWSNDTCMSDRQYTDLLLAGW